MSYEYRLIFTDTSTVQRLMDKLKTSDACVGSRENDVSLKDRGLGSAAKYDVRLKCEDAKSIWLEVNFRSPSLYRLIHEALHGASVRCFEDGDLDDEVTLKEAFRIKGDT